MDPRRAPPRAHFDFPTAQLSLGIDDQRADILPDIQYDSFGMDPVRVCFSHLPGPR
jgi:hypothetical protein